MASYWLVKQEPSTYSFAQLVKDRRTVWDGVRNHQARRNLELMHAGDTVLYYHTGSEKAVVGLARVARKAYPDPTDAAWVAVDLEAVGPLVQPVSLAAIKAGAALAGMALVRQARLSVMPVETRHFRRILELGQTAER